MKIALFGGTGFIGTYLVEKLLRTGHIPKVLVRPGSDRKLSHHNKCDIVTGTISDLGAVRDTISNTDGVIYNIGIIREFPRKKITFEEIHFKGARSCMNMASELGVERFILMSANGVKQNGTDYQKTKFLSEQYIKETDLEWTVFRPSLVFGDPRGKIEFCSQLRNDMLSIPLPAPLFYEGIIPKNAGSFALSPIHVKNVAEFFVKALDEKSTIRQTYEIGGMHPFSWEELVSIIATASGKKKWKIPTPVFPVKMMASVFGRFSWFPITGDQLSMLMEGNTCESKNLFEDFHIEPIKFSVSNLSYLYPG